MDEETATRLLAAERTRVEGLLAEADQDARSDRDAEDDASAGDIADPAERLTAEGLDDALATRLRDRLAALDRAEARVADGTYGRSIRSGALIPDERLEADPAAELTVEEASEAG